MEITPNFRYEQLDYLYGVSISDVIKVTAIQNELYRISLSAGVENMGKFYLYVVNHYPKLLATLEEYIYPYTLIEWPTVWGSD